MHPLVGDLTQLSTDELHKKFAELSKRLGYAYSRGMTDAAQQLQMIMASYKYEIDERNRKLAGELAKKMAGKEPEFKNIIDIG